MDTHKKKFSEFRFAILATDVVLLTLCEGELCVRLTAFDLPPHYSRVRDFPVDYFAPTKRPRTLHSVR